MPEIAGPELGDAFGCALLDQLSGRASPVFVERDDGLIDVDRFDYLTGWDDLASWAIDRARGRVLDVGAGAGRASLALQDRGVEVVALDISPGAAEVCRRRGVREVFLGTVAQLATVQPRSFDSVLLLGNNLGLMGSPDDAPFWFGAVGDVLRPGGIIVGTCLDPYQTSDAAHLAYHEHNRRRGRMAGQVTIRVRYQRLATTWFDLLLLSEPELSSLAAAHGWQVTGTMPGQLSGVQLARA